MGRDKALLPYGSKTLAQHAAERVLAAAGSATLVGNPEKYGHLGYPVIPDRMADCGPMGGIHAALSASESDWNLILGCDLPNVSAAELKVLLEHTGSTRCVTLGDQPLCAAYHRSCLGLIEQAIKDKRLRLMDLLQELKSTTWPALKPASLLNVNTPAEWNSIQRARSESD